MTRLNTFHLPSDQWPASPGDTVTLTGPEARHMGTVLRTEKGCEVRLFDGTGRSGLFKVREINKSRALLEVVGLDEHPSPSTGLTLAIGWGKSKRRTYLFEKTVELKGSGLIFWQAARSQGLVPAQPKESWLDKCVQAPSNAVIRICRSWTRSPRSGRPDRQSRRVRPSFSGLGVG